MIYILWCLLNILDLLLSWVAFQWGGGEFGLLRYISTDWSDFAAIKILMPPLIGGLLMVRRKYTCLSVLTIAIAMVSLWNAWAIFRQFP
ncbi:MAG: hypothetical protein Q8N51_01230 [Gammaproteobacteria bacterium]|nr:hypothetical protein [Gammaproteobacteria bacterium]